MKVVFCISDFGLTNIRLQPWLTVYEIASRLSYLGYDIHIITDKGDEYDHNGIFVHPVASLRGTNSRQINLLLDHIKPDCLIISVTPLSLITSRWYNKRIKCKNYAYISYPFYTTAEIFRAIPYIDNNDILSYGRHLLIPSMVWYNKIFLNFYSVICQSHRTANRFMRNGRRKIPVHTIPPGIDTAIWQNRKQETANADSADFTTLLYIGSPKRIRGFFILLDALSDIGMPGVRLKILARGANDDDIRFIHGEIMQRRLAGIVELQGGWMEQTQLCQEICNADAVVMPFVLVPSELPVSVMEVICCGTPVIISDLDGLPETAGSAGLVIPNGDIKGLAAAIRKIHEDKALLPKMRNACQRQSDAMHSWDEAALAWQKVLTS